MNWRIKYRKGHIFNWIEKHVSERVTIDLIEFGEKRSKENDGYQYAVEVYGNGYEKIKDYRTEHTVKIQEYKGTYKLRMNHLTTALEVVEELKEMFEKEWESKHGMGSSL